MADAPQPTNDDGKPQVSHIRTFASDVASVTGKPLQQDVANVPAPAPKRIQQAPPPVGKIIPKAPATNESKEAVLARLRGKLGVKTTVPQTLPTPSEPSSSREELLTRLREKAKPTPAAPPPPPAPPPVPQPPPPGIPPVSKDLAPIHTYKSDFAELVGKRDASPLSILSAEQDAKPAGATLKERKKAPISIVAGIALIVISIAGVSAAYLFTKERAVVDAPYVPSLIFADKHTRIEGSGQVLQEALASLATSDLQDGGVAIAYISVATTTSEGEVVERPATGGALIAALGLKAPDLLLRNAEAASTVGVVRAGGDTRVFFLLRVTSYERTFAGLLAWEKTMQQDLALFYPLLPSATTATTSVTFAQPTPFTDDVVANHDVRILRDTEGRSLLLYGYKDKETLIIARNEAAFAELLERLSATRAQ